jgi:hypothetical protein
MRTVLENKAMPTKIINGTPASELIEIADGHDPTLQVDTVVYGAGGSDTIYGATATIGYGVMLRMHLRRPSWIISMVAQAMTHLLPGAMAACWMVGLATTSSSTADEAAAMA